MQLIKLKPELFDLVRDGKKTATTRKGHKDIRLGKAEFVNPSDDTQRMSIEIETVSHFSYGDLTGKDYYWVLHHLADNEGYKCESEFLDVLTEIYGEIDVNEEMTVVHFRYLG